MEQSVEQRLLRPAGFLSTFERLASLVPAVILIATAPSYVYQAFCRRRYAKLNSIFWLKLIVVSALSAVQINTVFQWWETLPHETAITHWTAVASYMSMPCLALIALVDHLYVQQPQPFLSIFLLLTMAVDVGAFPTYFCPASLGPAADPRIAVLALKAMLLGLEQVPETNQFLPCGRTSDSRIHGSGCNLWRTPLGTWLRSVLLFGFRGNIEKEQQPELDENLQADQLYEKFATQWRTVDKSSPYALVWALIYTVPDLYLSTALPLIIKSIFRLSQPFLIRDVLLALPHRNLPVHITTRLVSTTVTVYFGLTASSVWAASSRATLTAAIRAITESAMYNKCLLLNASNMEISSISSIVHNDINKLDLFINAVWDNWNIALDTIFNITMLAHWYGPTAILLVVPALLAGANAIRVSRHELNTRQGWRRRTADHIAFTSNILAQIKEVKMLGLGSYFGKLMQKYQRAEISASLPVRDAESIGFIQGAFTESVTPMMAVAIAVFPLISTEALSMPELCAAAGIGLVSMQPLAFAVRSMSDRVRGFDCMDRIQKFLLQRDNRDSRICVPERMRVVERNPSTQQEVITRFAVQFMGASVTFDGQRHVLHDVSILIPRGKITMLYGRTGAGKSLFAKLVIGQAALSSGTLLVATTSIAYCAQVPWIRNISIRDNIIGQSPFDPVWFDLVIYICALDSDLARLAYGALTLAGSGGSSLSAGQRHRISFARSLYAKEDVIVVDDIFTSLDRRTASDIRVRLFGETEVLQEHNITLIMTTTMREHLVDADFALEITDDGSIIETSSEGTGASSDVLPTTLRISSEDNTNGVHAPQPPPLLVTGANDISSRAYGDFSLYNFYLKPAGIFLLLFWAYSLCAAAIVENLPVVFVCLWMEHAPDNQAFFLIFATLSLTNPIYNHFQSITYFYFIYTRTAKALYAKVAETTCRYTLNKTFRWFDSETNNNESSAKLDFLTSTDTDFLLNKFCQDVSLATERLPLLLMPAAWNFVLLIINMTAFGLATSGIVLPSFLLVYLFTVQRFLSRSTRHVRILSSEASTKASRHLSDTVSGADHIYSFGWQPAFSTKLYMLLKDQHRSKLSELCLVLWTQIMLSTSSAVAATSVVTHALHSEQEISPAIFAFAMFSVIVFTNNMTMLIRPWVYSDAVLGGLHGIRDFISSTPVEQDPANTAIVPIEWARRGKIELSCVTAQYRPIGGARHIALDHVTFTIQPGQVVGIAGRTGR
ncbi:hypothetical protein NLG97_g1040 [Lecanicillium saksenae]|uniref:Uncharacterized protein n=1 Tax=Lecanicillium saksenae TaxID=468837 RepID=A0ACC1R7I9_9HYPO|nr:hypothetical protein NLG97_g1040 [Lecanicillium saksenae]